MEPDADDNKQQPGGGGKARVASHPKSREWQLRKYLLLLAILVATVTYIAGLDPPGGVWLETTDEHLTGDPILAWTPAGSGTTCSTTSTRRRSVASLVLTILLLPFRVEWARLMAVRGVMVVDLVCLMVAYIAGSCRGRLTTIFASVLSATIFVYIVVHALVAPSIDTPEKKTVHDSPDKEKAMDMEDGHLHGCSSLSPPGGTWEHAAEEGGAAAAAGGHHRAGDPVLQEGHYWRFVAFFVLNTVAFVASLTVIMLLLSTSMGNNGRRLSALNVAIAFALLGLMGAYASGSCRETETTVYVLCLIGAVLLYISCLAVIKFLSKKTKPQAQTHGCCGWMTATARPCPACRSDCASPTDLGPDPVMPGPCQGEQPTEPSIATGSKRNPASKNREDSTDPVERARSLILLLATLITTVTYQAGLDPPGGVWRDDDNGHSGGGLILPATHAKRYKVFFYCNSAAFVASIIVIIMVQSRSLIGRRALEAAVILDLFGLIGAYSAGSCRDVRTSIYVFSLAVAIFVLVVAIYVVISKLPHDKKGKLEEKSKLEKKQKLLLLLAILAVTITYQAGLTPPGGFWIEHTDEDHRYGDSILADNYPLRYKAFFYCNATSFMASVIAIVCLMSQNLSSIAVGYCNALYACMAAGLVGLMGAYAAGTTRRLRTSIYVFALVGAVLIFAALHIKFFHKILIGCLSFFSSKKQDEVTKNHDQATGSKGSTGKKCTNNHDEETTDEYKEKYKMRKYLTLLGILAASVTYQAGLVPPGSVWPTNDGKGHAAGNPILGDTDGRRYHAFFYSNSTSFAASIVAIVLLLQGTLILPELNDPDRFGPMHMVVVLDLLGLLVAYAAGSSRDWGTSGYVVAMAVMVLAYVAIYVFLSLRDRKGSEGRATTEVRSSSSTSQSSRSTLEVARPASRSSGSADNV
ncbi:hypothetical protein OsI_22627 [Oryza sativa Indica Group]|uniref:PGG domain-containing protein n=1 Tax=Oryza sativa subsp. indica TaxID=39946 RepID=B8B0U7_ORYSI|nr:hypothetical protein OsI_22627 [Oryza sativa Indica Group]